MQDKELDFLFKKHLESAEVKPPQGLWDQIDLAIKPKKVFPWRWVSAASIVLALGSITYLVSEQQTQPQVITQHRVEAKQAPVIEVPVLEDRASQVSLPAVHQAHSSNRAVILVNQNSESATVRKPLTLVEEPAELIEQSSLAKLELTAVEALNTDITEELPPMEIQKLTYTAQLPQQENVNEAPPERIRNAGDVINFIVSKVDKREEKFIQFRTDEDETSTLASINIGPFKFGKKRK